jgi:hypothetical protein
MPNGNDSGCAINHRSFASNGHYGNPGVTGSIKVKGAPHPLGYTGEDDDRLPIAEPGED